jgi:hypothetical protein
MTVLGAMMDAMAAVTSVEDARSVADDLLAQHLVGEHVRSTDIIEYETCWVVGYQSLAFLETGAISHALAGGPIIVNRATGVGRFGASFLPADQQLDPQ